MGFRFKRYDYTGGVSPMSGAPFRDSRPDAISRSQALCKDFADFIISCGKGWALDTSRNATTSDFVDVPVWNFSKQVQSFYYPALFFTNLESGCKLFLSVIGTTSDYGIALEDSNFALDYIDTSYPHLLSGTVMAIIPSGSTNNFGATFDNTFLPSDATLMRGTVNIQIGGSISDPAGWWLTPTCYATTGNIYSYGLFVDTCCVGVSGSISTNGIAKTLLPGFFIGRILGTLAHTELTNQARYGSISFSFGYYINSLDQEFYLKPYIDETDNQFDRYGRKFSTEINSDAGSGSNSWKALWDNYGSVVKANGDRLDAHAGNIRFMADVEIFNSKVTSLPQSNATRWIPYEVAVCSNNLTDYGIIAGDGFKGYLDTSLFRCGLVTLNQTYDNGNFCGWDHMLMIGWDALNTDAL